MKRKYVLVVIIALSVTASYSQNFAKRNKALFAAKDTASLRPLLKEWEESDPNDPEMLVAQFNYYVLKSKREYLGSDKAAEQKAKAEHDTAAMQTAHIINIAEYDSVFIKKGMKYINFGIKANPNRLDMRFGKIYLLGEMKHFEDYTREILNVIEHSHINKNAWRWTNNVPNATPFDFMVTSLHHYVNELTFLGDPKQNQHTKIITQTILKYYPDDYQSLVTLANIKLAEKQYDKCNELLHRAQALLPNDAQVVLAYANYYRARGDKTKAIQYFEKALPLVDEPKKEFVLKDLEELKKP